MMEWLKARKPARSPIQAYERELDARLAERRAGRAERKRAARDREAMKVHLQFTHDPLIRARYETR